MSAETVPVLRARNLSEFRLAVSRSFVPLQVSCGDADRFRGTLRVAATDDVHLTNVSASAHTVERTPELIGRSDHAYFKVSLLTAGTGILVQNGREAVLTPGDLAVYDTQRPYSLAFDDDFQTTVVMFPKNLINLPADLIEQLCAIQLCGKDGLGAVVAGFLTQLGANLDQLSGATGARLVNSALDLLSTVFIRELGLDAPDADPRQALLHRIRAYIDANLASTDLSPTSIAAAHYISTRHLHGLFRDHGASVSTWIRSRRLDRCRRDLRDRSLADRPVAAIAAQWGFVDAAHFSRVFKATYAISPSEYRGVR